MGVTLVRGPEQVTGNPIGLAFSIGTSVAPGTTNSVLFVDASTQLAQDSNFKWFPDRHWLAIGSATPVGPLHVGTNSLVVLGGGNVGVGTTTPGSLFSVAGAASISDGSALRWGDSDNVRWLGNSSTNVLSAYTSGAERLRIDAVGRVGVGTTSPAGHFDVSGVATNNGLTIRAANALQLNNSADTFSAKVKAASALAANLTFTLPTSAGSAGQVLQTDGSGTLSFVTISGNTAMEGVIVGAQTGSILFTRAGSILAQDNTQLFYDQANHRLGLGTQSPTARISSLVGATGNMAAFDITQNDVTNNPRGMLISSLSSRAALAILGQGNTPAGFQEGTVFIDGTTNNGIALNVISNNTSPLTTVVQVRSNNTAFSQPLLTLQSAATLSQNPLLTLQSPIPSFNLVESDQTSPAGKFLVEVSTDLLKIMGRNNADTQYDSVITIQRKDKGGVGVGGKVGILVGDTDASSTLQVLGSFAPKSVSKTSDYSLTDNDHTVLANASTNGISIFLPAVSGIPGRQYRIIKTAASPFAVQVVAAGSDRIQWTNTLLTVVNGATGSVLLTNDGSTNWFY